MFAVSVAKPGKVELVQIPIPDPGPYEVLIRTEVAFLCNATDRKLVEGHFPGVEKYPLLLGHENAGIVEKVGAKVRSFKKGDRVIGGLVLNPPDPTFASGWGGFCEYTIAGDHVAMKEDGVADEAHGWYEVTEIMRKIPDHIPVEAAALFCTWREVYGGIGDFNLQPGNNILIFGAGPVGLSFVKFCRILGIGYIGVVEFFEEKRELALKMGASEVFAPDEEGMKSIQQKWKGKLDAVIDAVGKESIINNSLPLVKLGGSVCVYGVIDTTEILVKKNVGPYNFNLLVHQWPTRWREAAAQEPLCKWIEDGKLDFKEFLSAEFSIKDINKALDHARAGHAIKTLLRY